MKSFKEYIKEQRRLPLEPMPPGGWREIWDNLFTPSPIRPTGDPIDDVFATDNIVDISGRHNPARRPAGQSQGDLDGVDWASFGIDWEGPGAPWGEGPMDMSNPEYAEWLRNLYKNGLSLPMMKAMRWRNTIGPDLFPGLMAQDSVAWDAFQDIMFQFNLTGWMDGISDSSAVDFLNILHDMDISIAWDANAGTISFNHTNPVINQELQNHLIGILQGFPGSADGMVGDEDAMMANTFIVLLIEILESGDSPFG